MTLLQKAVLAGVSGLLCSVVYDFGFDGGWPEPLYYGVSGALFGAGVLFPYLKRDGSVWYRGLGLIVISTLSFWCAIETMSAMSHSYGPDAEEFLAASLVGAFIVLAGARFIVPLHRSIELAVAGLPAAIIGALPFHLTIDIDSRVYLAFMTWHILMAVAIYIAENWSWRTGKCQ
jgi:hypothetical protein